MDSASSLPASAWVEIDPLLLGCNPKGAFRSVRGWTEAGPEEAQEILRQRFRQLRSDRPDAFAWARFPCQDYLDSHYSESGYYDTGSEMMLVVPAWEVTLRAALDFLPIGGPGVDGIEWGYRVGHEGLWAFYPFDRKFVLMAPSVAELVDRWVSGDLAV